MLNVLSGLGEKRVSFSVRGRAPNGEEDESSDEDDLVTYTRHQRLFADRRVCTLVGFILSLLSRLRLPR